MIWMTKCTDLAEIAITRPELSEIFVRNATDSTKKSYAFYALSVFAYALHMHQRGIIKENEWNGWLRTIRKTFEEGAIGDYWKDSKLDEWFDPEFRTFLFKICRKINRISQVR